jgi:hypothetical protein
VYVCKFYHRTNRTHNSQGSKQLNQQSNPEYHRTTAG